MRLLLLLLCIAAAAARAGDPGKPVAVRWWGGSAVSIETWWGLVAVVDRPADEPTGDVVLRSGGNPAPRRDANIVWGVDSRAEVKPIFAVLDRLANEPEPRFGSAIEMVTRSPHAMTIRSIASTTREGDANAMFLIAVDGVRILHCGRLGQRRLSPEQIEQAGAVDMLLIGDSLVPADAAAICEQLRPRIVTPMTGDDHRQAFLSAMPDRYRLVRAAGNTTPVTADRGPTRARPTIAILHDRPWRMPDEMAVLEARATESSRAAQKLIRSMTERQLDHRPADGTHTVRWNAEHMMSAELFFFTSAYEAIDESIPKIALFPEQKPADYRPANPRWTPAEEARQMERARALVRRFAYLLDGLPLDELPEGAPRFLRSLEGMWRQPAAEHYAHHAEMIREKSNLPDWPTD